jgi:hypothetical protein
MALVVEQRMPKRSLIPYFWPSALVVVAALASHTPSFVHQLFDPDEGAIATLGMVASRSGVLYRDVIDRKPPGAPLLYSAIFRLTGTQDLRFVHFFLALELAACALILAAEARRGAGRTAGWWAAGLFLAGAIAFAPRDAQAANFSQLALLPACAAIVTARRNSGRYAAVAGVMLGLAVLTRQTWVVGVIPAAFAAWLHGGRRIGRATLVVGGAAATIAAIAFVVPFAAFWHWTFSANGSLLSDMLHSSQIIPRALASALIFLAGHVVLCWLAARKGWHREDLDLWLWVATGLLSVAVGFRFFSHYWFQVLPALCLLAAPVAAAATRTTKRVVIGVIAITTVLCWSVAWVPYQPKGVAPLVAAVKRDTRPSDRIAIWGSFPEVYWLSGREPSGSFVLSDLIVDRNGALNERSARSHHLMGNAATTFVRSLNANPPRLFLDTSTANLRDYENYPLSLVPAAANFVHDNYRPIGRVDGVTIYELARSLKNQPKR